MKKDEILEILQSKARQLADLEKWLQDNKENRLAEFVSVQRLINFKAQDIFEKYRKEDVKNAFYAFCADLLASLRHAKEYQSNTLLDLYASALDYLHSISYLVDNYLL